MLGTYLIKIIIFELDGASGSAGVQWDCYRHWGGPRVGEDTETRP